MSEPSETTAERRDGRRLDALIGWLGLLLGIGGLVSGYVYYQWTITYPEVTWWSTTQIVFNSQNSNPDIRLSDRSGSPIQQNVYTTNISVSNTGTALLEQANVVGSIVRSPVTITLRREKNLATRILGASIVSISEQSPVNLSCRLADEVVTITWDHLDPGSGFRLLLMYAAPQQLSPNLSISIVGMRGPNEVDLTHRTTEVPKPPETDTFFGILAFIVGATLFLGSLIVLLKLAQWMYRNLGLATLSAGVSGTLSPIIEQKVLPFFKRHSSTFESIVEFVLRVIVYGWLPGVVIGAIILITSYSSTLLDFWHLCVSD